MKKYLLLCLTVLFFKAGAQNQASIDSGSFWLHKFEQHIGKETYHVHKAGNVITYSVDLSLWTVGRLCL